MKLKLRQSRPTGRMAWAFAALIPLVLAVGAASAAPGTDLTDPDVRFSDSFYPCPGQTDFSRGPLVSECLDGSLQRLQPAIVDAFSCNPAGTSTVTIDQRTSGQAFVPGGGWLAGMLTWEIDATIGPQSRPAVPSYQPFPDDGAPVESFGFQTGLLESFTGTFTIDPFDSSPDISGTVTLAANEGNWGICREFFEEPSGSPNVAGGFAPVTGEFFVLNAGVLTYEVTSGPAALVGETGIAESFLTNSFATCCDAENPTQVVNATGHFKQQFGTIHPAEGTSGSASTPTGSNVEVSDFAGLDEDVGGVTLTFASVGTAGETTVTLLTEMPEQPSGFQVGDPPAVYEISTTAVYGGPITVCLPYGSLPAGETPRIMHFVDGDWVPVPIVSDSGLPDQIVCGEVSSLSPFAVGFFEEDFTVTGPFQPVDTQPTVNTMKAGRTVPVKFSLGGDFGLDVFADGYPASQNVPCDGGIPDPIESTTATNASGLTYDAVTDTYQYNWKTESSWKGQCRTLILEFADGDVLEASFKFN